jgi:hypothetical protein
LEGLLYTDNPHGDQTRPLKDLQTLIESKISTAMQSMTNFLRARGITIARFEISTSLSYDKPPMPVKKNGKDH